MMNRLKVSENSRLIQTFTVPWLLVLLGVPRMAQTGWLTGAPATDLTGGLHRGLDPAADQAASDLREPSRKPSGWSRNNDAT